MHHTSWKAGRRYGPVVSAPLNACANNADSKMPVIAGANGTAREHQPTVLETLACVVHRQQREIDEGRRREMLLLKRADDANSEGITLRAAIITLDHTNRDLRALILNPELDPPDDTFAGLEDALARVGQLDNARRYLLAVIHEEMRQRANINSTGLATPLWTAIRMCQIAGIDVPEPITREAVDAAAD